MVGIYALINTVNGKMYIGQSVNIMRRWKDHRNIAKNSKGCKSHYPLYRAIRKYDLENFDFVILEVCQPEELNDRETYWIDYYDTLEEGYNLVEGGQQPVYHTSKLNNKEAKEIRFLLLNTFLSHEKIGEKFGVARRTVGAINLGETWRDPTLNYPLRKEMGGGQAVSKIKPSYCLDCGILITQGAIRCRDCYSKAPKELGGNRKAVRPTREELKDLIRTTPFVQIGKKYGVSDNAIRKWCDNYELPRRVKDIKILTNEEWELI